MSHSLSAGSLAIVLSVLEEESCCLHTEKDMHSSCICHTETSVVVEVTLDIDN